jgi:hypothetical protein
MLGVKPEKLSTQRWKSFAHHWCSYNETSTPMQAHCFHINEVFANCSDEDKIYPLTTVEIAAAQWADASLITSLSAMQKLIKDWRSNSLRTRPVFAKMVGWLSPSHSKCMQLSAIIATYSTLDTPHTSRGDDEYCNVLERYAYHHPFTNKVLQILPSK